MNLKLLNDLALKTGGSFFPDVFEYYQKEYILNVLLEIYKVYRKGHDNSEDDYLAIDFWDDIILHFQLDSSDIDKLLKNNNEIA
jgi:hypothetical protein